MTQDDGGGRDRLAPVIPLFGGASPARAGHPTAERPATPPVRPAAPERARRDETPPSAVAPAETAPDLAPAWRSTWDEPVDDGGEDLGEDADAEHESAERVLTRKLRTRQLSVSEARTVLVAQSLDADAVTAILHAFERRGYLDDRSLAEQLVHAAVERKGQGRRVIAQSLAKRGIPRDVTDAALADLPDDDAERALEFARQKARAMRGLERDVALRRLAGQLARRGYGSSALDAARQALDEL